MTLTVSVDSETDVLGARDAVEREDVLVTTRLRVTHKEETVAVTTCLTHKRGSVRSG